MASNCLILLVTLTIISISFQTTTNNEIKEEESSPISDIVSSILKEQNAQNIGSMVQNFLQKDGANLIGEALSNMGKQNAGQLLQGLSHLIANQQKDGKRSEEGNPLNLLETLGSIAGNLQGAGGAGDEPAMNAGALFQGLGSLLSTAQGGQGGIDPSIIGQLADVFSQSSDKDGSKTTKNSKSPKKIDKIKKKDNDEFNVGDVLSIAGSLLGLQGEQGKSQTGGFMSMLPMILQTISSFSGPDAEQRERKHSEHSSQLPPFLEKIHVSFDHFIHSDMGKYVISSLGAEKVFNVFMDDHGEFDYQKFGELMENRSFRRHWIRLITDKVTSFLQYASNPKVYKSFLTNAQYFANSYLKSQGFPKSTLFDPQRPVETISSFVNHVAKKYFDMKISSREYVQPAVEYFQDILRLTEKKGPIGNEAKELGNKLADTLNMEVIEPLARVNRAYRFANNSPKCARYVLCLVNLEEDPNEVESLPGLKKVLYKGSSLVAAWFLSSNKEIPFWSMYSEVTEGSNCKSLHVNECDGFHVEELKATTEYVHNEL